MTSDPDLLRKFVDGNSQQAFADLVRRHLDMVYSSARRQVGSAELAKDVTQTVFIKLSQQAAHLKPDTLLGPWLYVVTRHSAVDLLRQERRRRAREDIAHQIAVMKTAEANWCELEPLLDEAMESLNEIDRSAILLRFFETKSLRDVGRVLQISEDNAQKRVSRAIVRLQDFFSKRGIAVGTGALATQISTHAVQSAPAGMSLAIAAALPPGVVATAYPLSNAIVMTTLQKAAVTAAFVIAAGTACYETIAVQRQRLILLANQQRTEALQQEIHSLRAGRDLAKSRLNATERQIDFSLAQSTPPAVGSDAALELRMKAWIVRIERLKNVLRQRPQFYIPELELLPEKEWFDAVAKAKLVSDQEIRLSLAGLRNRARNALAEKMSEALTNYAAAHAGFLPGNPADLAPFLNVPNAGPILDGYEMLQTGKLVDAQLQGQGMFRGMVIATKSPADVEYDSFWARGTRGQATTGAAIYDVVQAQREYAKANHGRKPVTSSQLSPFLRWPLESTTLERFWAIDPPPEVFGPSPTVGANTAGLAPSP